MESWGGSEVNSRKATWYQPAGTVWVIAGCLLLWLGTTHLRAGPLVSTENPTAFFTNVAARLLQSELQVDLNRIVVYPTNQYRPSVHRLLQVTANLYDATTNRGDYPFLPSVFRPLFRRTDAGEIVIAGYREVVGDGLVRAATAPPFADLESGTNTNSIPVLGTPFGVDQEEPLVAGIPLIIGARKGFPNFNEFAMQNALQIARRLRFERDPSSIKITATNQIFIVSITNVFGVEAWNSYASSFPRPLEMIAVVDLAVEMTNEWGIKLVSNRVVQSAITYIPANTWTGYNASFPLRSFRMPLSTNITLQPGVVYSPTANNNTGAFVTPTNFESPPASGPFYLPHWWLNLTTRLRFILVDNTNIIDYVTLCHSESPLDLTYELTKGVNCDDPTLTEAKAWCTNRVLNAAADDDHFPTRGILSQIQISKGAIPANTWWSYMLDPSVSGTKEQVIGAFWYNMYGIISPQYPGTYYRSNVFFAPYVPVGSRFTKVSWQANDPLVHYTLRDLLSLSLQPQVDDTPDYPLLRNLGVLNARYEPWDRVSGINPTIAKCDLSAKDPLVFTSDAWDFPTNQPLNLSWLGRIHRGTPWQTIYLKSRSIDIYSWAKWVGAPNAYDAQRLHPTNDWHLVQVLANLFNTNDPRNLLTLNQPDAAAWAGALDGMVALTNIVSDTLLLNGAPAQFDTLTIASNTPSATSLGTALDTVRYRQPGQHFRELGDLLAVPELTVASPWLNWTNTIQQRFGISDAAYEMLPSQLLPRLRPDSVASILSINGNVQLQFTGLDDYDYAVEVSPDLVTWTAVSTNRPSNGSFQFVEPTPPNSPQRFYRSVLLP